MKQAIIFDLDGTLADISHRLHYIHGGKKDWDAFFEACDEDKLIEHVAKINYALDGFGISVHIVSGRSDQVRTKTKSWLFKNFIVYKKLYMRKAGDHRPDDELKLEFLEQIRADGYEPIMAFEDRSRVVQMWRKAGIPCLQVAEGDF